MPKNTKALSHGLSRTEKGADFRMMFLCFSYGGIIRIRYKGRNEELLTSYSSLPLSLHASSPDITPYHYTNYEQVSMEKILRKILEKIFLPAEINFQLYNAHNQIRHAA